MNEDYKVVRVFFINLSQIKKKFLSKENLLVCEKFGDDEENTTIKVSSSVTWVSKSYMLLLGENTQNDM